MIEFLYDRAFKIIRKIAISIFHLSDGAHKTETPPTYK